MPSPEDDEINSYLDRIIEDTEKMQMKWDEANPTTFVWSPPAKPGKIVLQRIAGETPTSPPSFVLRVLRGQADELAIGGASTIYNSKLAVLFRVIRESIKRRGLDFLKSLLE